jgi:hypothetical protein
VIYFRIPIHVSRTRFGNRRNFVANPNKPLILSILFSVLIACNNGLPGSSNSSSPKIHFDQKTRSFHVYAGENIQNTLDAAAKDRVHKTVKVHAGTYRPQSPGEALIWLNREHDGITLEAEGTVILTAANPDIADPTEKSYPAVVNHVVYFGDGISSKTIFRGFKITGANNYIIGSPGPSPIEPGLSIKERLFFYADGGGIKIFGRSYPTIENIEVYNNYTGICGAGISVEHRGGLTDQSVHLKNCIIRNNRTGVTGSAVDLLWGSSATIENCLFTGNVSNTGVDYNRPVTGHFLYKEKHGSGALTVFPRSRVVVVGSTFTDNFNGVDDEGPGSAYRGNIFWNNNRTGGLAPGDRYELDLADGKGVTGNFIHGNINDLQDVINPAENRLDPPDPLFDDAYMPHSKEYSEVGYRPKN